MRTQPIQYNSEIRFIINFFSFEHYIATTFNLLTSIKCKNTETHDTVFKQYRGESKVDQK